MKENLYEISESFKNMIKFLPYDKDKYYIKAQKKLF